MLTLRKYQEEASKKIVEAVMSKLPGGSIVSLPTGSGKSLVIADATNKLNRPTLIICPSQEILKQDRDELLEHVSKEEIGIFSASLNSKTIKKYTLATVGSIYKKPELFKEFGLIIADECDLLPPGKGMFVTFWSRLNNPTLIGLTATPFRMVSEKKYWKGFMSISSSVQLLTKISPTMWPRIIYHIDNWELVKAGYITPLQVLNESPLVPFEEIKESSADFNLKSYAYYASREDFRLTATIRKAAIYYNSVLVFCCTVEQAERLSEQITGSEVISAKTMKKNRTRIIDGFRKGSIKVVFNVGVLTCGFNHPALDCVVLARPTKSPRLFYQIAGRAVRKFEGKLYGTMIDLTDSTKNIGRIESIQLKQVDEAWQLHTSVGRIDGKILYKYEMEI